MSDELLNQLRAERGQIAQSIGFWRTWRDDLDAYRGTRGSSDFRTVHLGHLRGALLDVEAAIKRLEAKSG